MTIPNQPGLSLKAERVLREAMERLFSGRPIRTDGKLTEQNLWIGGRREPSHHEPRNPGTR